MVATPAEGGALNTKKKGNRNEHRSMAILESAGYACCRSAASLGAFDIIGIGFNDIVLCQVKTRDWPGAAETETIRVFPAPANCRKLIHRWRDRQRLPDVKEVSA
jgi:Holliday junction resolvase-like predicted endonuclease